MARALVVLTLLSLTTPAFADADCGEQKMQIDATKKVLGALPFNVGKVVESLVLVSPEEQLRPGDILVYPFHEHQLPDGAKEGESPPKEPDAYKAALEGYGHAAIVARDEDGKLFRLESPHAPIEETRDFGGKRPYYVIRPAVPDGMTRDAFEKKVSTAAQCLQRVGFEYDPLMKMDYLDKASLAKMKRVVADCPTEPGRGSPFPPQSCAELTQTVLALAGAATAQPATAAQLLDLAITSAKKSATGKDLDRAVESAIDDVIRMFSSGGPEAAKEIGEEKKKLEATLAEARERDEDTEELERRVADVAEQLKRIQSELANFRLAKGMLTMLAKQRLAGKSTALPGFGDPLAQPVVRPFDILAEGLRPHGSFRAGPFYLGHLARCTRPPEAPPPDSAPLPAPAH